ncbi:MAG: HRDC domain-containing protein [Woeseiaceae bacterium]|nr:HRDC domain-containing protein [Woeseiaceae bacterium]
MPDYQYVDLASDDQLTSLLSGQSRIGVDTEFVREKTFHAELCLIQVAVESGIYCADPLRLDAQGSDRAAKLWQSLTSPAWILHSGRQDLEVIYQTAGVLPGEIFDTQVAAALLGYQPQIGYGNLVRELFGVELAKSHTRADWSQRPLPDTLIEYAAEDVEYLLPAHDSLARQLEDRGRLEWAVEDSRDLLDVSLYRNDPAQAIERLKGARNLRGKSRAAAVRLAAWREQEAMRRNRPRQWIMRDPVLLDIAVKRPDSRDKLGQTPGLSPKTLARTGDQLLDAVAAADGDRNDYEPPKKPNASQAAMLKKMQTRVSQTAADLDLAPELIAPKKELSAAMLGQRDLRIFRGWRRELLGNSLLEMLDDA